MRRGLLPGSGTHYSLDKIAHCEEQQQNKHPRKLTGDHGDVVISLIHDLLATGEDVGVVPLHAADLLIPTEGLSTFSDAVNKSKNKKPNGECKRLVGKHGC